MAKEKSTEQLNLRIPKELVEDLDKIAKILRVNKSEWIKIKLGELVHEEKFDPKVHKPEKLPVKLRRTCNKCPEHLTCTALCPDVLKYVSQDTKYQRETPKPDLELDILSSPRSHRKAPKPTID